MLRALHYLKKTKIQGRGLTYARHATDQRQEPQDYAVDAINSAAFSGLIHRKVVTERFPKDSLKQLFKKKICTVF